jgi:type II secretory pathway component GspD/PulD (secretin)
MSNTMPVTRSAIIIISLLVFLAAGHLPAGAQEGAPSGLISLDADSTSVNAILQVLASRSGLNIVTGPEVRGQKISIHLKNTPFEEALNLVVRGGGFGYERVGNSILVGSQQRLTQETGVGTRVFDLQYANATGVRSMLEVISKDVAADVADNRVVIRGSQAVLDQAAAVVEQLDRKPQQVLLEARLIEVNTTALLEVGIDWEKIAKWSTVITEGAADASSQGQLPALLDFTPIDETKDYYRQLSAFQVAIDALLTDGNARLLSNASVTTTDGKAAEIFAGDTVPVIITSLASPGSSGGVLQTVQLDYIDVGVKLNITPRVANDGTITTLVVPEVSRITGWVGAADDLPQTATRKVSTLVRVKDGEKIYLGGLLLDEKRTTVKRVPLLGSIPLLGYLFQHRKQETVRLDLVVEITPHLVGDSGALLPTRPQTEQESQ